MQDTLTQKINTVFNLHAANNAGDGITNSHLLQFFFCKKAGIKNNCVLAGG